ncbi:MAG: YciI family protein [Saprospiraceae bacterium]|nr:YciI family protein [Saprospiraceae bacterium]
MMHSFQTPLIILLVAFLASCTNPRDEDTDNDTYDPQLAEQVGADAYGMKKYYMAFLKAGPSRDQDSTTAAQIQRAHLDNITRLSEEGILVLAGPFLDQGEIRGIYIFDVDTEEKARALTESDPAVQAGRLVMELHPWYGSAALLKVREIHNEISREEI